jgi:hypothetical protein
VSSLSTPTLEAPVRGRRRRAAGVLLVFAGVVAAFLAYDRWQQQRAWQEAVAEADRLDPGWRWDDLRAARSPPPPERNSVAHVEAALNLLPEWVKPGRLKDREAQKEYQGMPPRQRPSPRVVAGLRELLDAAAPALAEADALADCPDGRVALPDSPTIRAHFDNNAMSFLTLYRGLLHPQLVFQAEAGDPDAALATVRALTHASRALADGPTLMNVLVAEALHVCIAQDVERVLAQGEPSPAALDAARQVLETELDRPLLLAALRGERASLEDTVRALDEGRVSWDEVAKVPYWSDPRLRTGRAAVDRWLSRLTGGGFTRANATAAVQHYTWLIECLKESLDGLRARSAECAELRRQLPRGVATYFDYLVRYDADMRRDEARFRAAAVALAAESFRRAEGRWPKGIDELVPKYLTAVPRDPFDQGPLKLAASPDGVVVYSVGPDGKDDGGAVWSEDRRKGDDVGIRLWDPDRRRQAPPPAKSSRADSKRP